MGDTMTGNATVEQRLASLEAVEAIRKLKARYFHACDSKQPDLIGQCFAEGEIDLRYGRIGNFDRREQLVAIFTELACHEHMVEVHHGQNPQIEMLGADEATAIWGLYYYLIDTRQNTVTQLTGFYDDGYIRVDGDWRIQRSSFQVSSTQIFDLSEGLAKLVFAGAEAPPELDDPTR